RSARRSPAISAAAPATRASSRQRSPPVARCARTADMGVRYFGASVPRIEDPDLIAGRGRYLDDIRLPGMLEVAFLRSPHAHASIRSIDTRSAQALPGVVAVLTAADLGIAGKATPQFAPSPLIRQSRTQEVLASGAVHYVSEA